MNRASLFPPRSSWITSLIVIVLLAGTAVLAIRALAPPEVLPADAPAAEFSAARAALLLKPIAAEPHPMGVPAHDWVRDTILRDWRALGLEPVVQTGVRFRPAGWEATRVENILVRLPGTKARAGRALMLSTHYDSVEPAPGAADDGAGVVTLLETARALLAGPRLAQDIIFLITDGEEDGLVGAQVFCDQHPWAKEVGLALNFEARGTAGSSLMYQTSRGNRELIAALALSPHPRSYSFAGTVYRHMPNAGDLTVFMRSGMQGLDFAFIERPYDYHTANDRQAHLDLRSLQHHGSYALALARRFGDDGVPGPAGEDAVYFSLFGDVFIHYPSWAALVLAALIIALVAAAVVVAFARRGVRLGGVLSGGLFFVGVVAASAVLSYAFLAAVKASHGSWLQPGPYRYNAFYLLALVFLAAAVTTGFYNLLRRRAAALELTLGALVFWALLTVALTFMFPDASYLASWPALFLSLAVLNWSLRRRKEPKVDPAPDTLSAVLAGGLAMLIFAPVVFLFFLAMFLSPLFAAILAAVTALALTAMLPAVEVIRRGFGRALPAACAVLFLAFAVAGALTTRFTERIPRLASFSYLVDGDAGRAYWIFPGRDVDPWTEQVMGGPPRPGHPLPEYESVAGRFVYREAPALRQAPPEVQLVADSTAGGARALRFRISLPMRYREVFVRCESDKILSAHLSGQALALPPREVKTVATQFQNPPPEGFEVSFEVPAGRAASLVVRGENPGLPALENFTPPQPPPGILPHRILTVIQKTYRFPAGRGD